MKASLLLTFLGLGMAGIYLVNFTLPFDIREYYATPLLDLGKITGYQPVWAARFTLGVLALFALYIAAWGVVRKANNARGKIAIFGFAVLFQALLLPTYPVGAADVFDYVMHARVSVVHQANPFVEAPDQFPADPYLPFAAWPWRVAVYGPLWALVGVPGAYLSEGGGLLPALIYYKGLAAFFVLATGFLLHRVLRWLGNPRPWAGTLLFLWNPLIAFEFAGNAHNDALLVFLLLFSVSLFVIHKFRFSFLALAFATLTKFVTAPLFVPLGATMLLGQGQVKSRLKVVITGLVLAMALTILLYFPFWQGWETLSFLERTALFTTSLAALLARILAGIWGWETATQFVRLLSLAALGLGVVLVTWRWARGSTSGFLISVYEILFLILIIGLTWVKPWYIAWLLAVAPLIGDSRREVRALLFTLTGFLSYSLLAYIWPLFPVPLSDLQVEAMLTGTVVFPVLLYVAIAHWPRRKEEQTAEFAPAIPGDNP